MDELEALNMIISDGAIVSNNKSNKKRRPPRSEIWNYIEWAIGGLLLLLLIIYLAIHPIDRLCLQFALFDNYQIQMSADGPGVGGGGTVKVDGNIMFSDGKYYEIGEKISYEYRERDGQWYRYRYYPSSKYEDDFEFILNSSNIERHFLPFVHMDINKKDAFGLTDTKIQVLLDKCKITGKDQVWDYWNGKVIDADVTIVIHSFGLIKLELPENYIIVE